MARASMIPALCFLLGCGGGAGASGRVEIATNFVSGDNCPSITSAFAAPTETSVGGRISVVVTATDPDPGFTCASPGLETLVITVSDNHAPTPCTARAVVAVRCVPR